MRGSVFKNSFDNESLKVLSGDRNPLIETFPCPSSVVKGKFSKKMRVALKKELEIVREIFFNFAPLFGEFMGPPET